jgi:hypothetical protein
MDNWVLFDFPDLFVHMGCDLVRHFGYFRLCTHKSMRSARLMSAMPLIAAHKRTSWEVRVVPQADVLAQGFYQPYQELDPRHQRREPDLLV